MNITEYANSNLGGQIDNGQGGYVGECVSLVIRAMNSVYGVPFGTLYCSKTGGARDLFEQFDGKIPQYFDRIANNPNDYNQLPKPGDLIVWGGSMGAYGHVGVVIQANPLKVYQQLGTPVFRPREIKQYPNYNGVLGWLRPKVSITQGGTMFENDQQIQDMYYLLRGRNATAEEVAGWRGKPIISFAQNQYAKQEVSNRETYKTQLENRNREVEQALLNEQAKPPKEVIKEVIKVIKEPVEVPVEVPIYITDTETRDNTKKILSMVTSIFEYFSGQYKSFKKYVRKG